MLPTSEKGIHSKVLHDLLTNGKHPEMLRIHEKLPKITDEQVRQEVTVVREDYWQLSCWKCHDEGHYKFTFPLLQPSQRFYFAYRYYLHQIAWNPAMKNIWKIASRRDWTRKKTCRDRFMTSDNRRMVLDPLAGEANMEANLTEEV